MNKNTIISVVLVLAVLAGGYFILSSDSAEDAKTPPQVVEFFYDERIDNVICPQTEDENKAGDFQEVGNLIKNNPGLPEGEWFLIYEKLGNPALVVALSFGTSSRCFVGGEEKNCDTYEFSQGDRVEVVGDISEVDEPENIQNNVEVMRLNIID